MQVIAHNLLSQFTSRQLNISSNSKKKSTEKLSSGYRINRASDDAAGLKISEKMRTQIRGLSRGEQNTQEGISWIQVGDGAMNEMLEITQRIRELAVQAANDTNSELERNAIDNEIKQLRKEINMISCETEFNKQKVFQNSDIMIDADGEFNDLQVYNASYDSTTGRVTYGGFIFDGNRVSWDSISTSMVELDASGNQIFTGGNYTYTEPNTGTQFHIVCEPGAKTPKISRDFRISANANGISIDGIRHLWSELRDENGNPPIGGRIEPGAWEINHKGASLAFFTAESCNFSEMADLINKSCSNYTWKMNYTGSENVLAVDASVMKNLRLSNNTVDNMMTPDDKLSFQVRADTTGIWLEESSNPGTMINGSKKTWADIGINDADWNSGNKISKNYTYSYHDSEGTNDTFISFDFELDEVTSLDSVIDGLDGMEISGGDITNSYAALLDITDNNIKTAYIVGGNKVHFSEEKDIDRNFDDPTDKITSSTVQYDNTDNKVWIDFPDKTGTVTDVIAYKGNGQEANDIMKRDLSTYLTTMYNLKKNNALAGKTTSVSTQPPTIRDILGPGAITPDGYLSDTVTINSSMIMTDGEKYFKPGEENKTYPAASLDFGVIGVSKSMRDLVGTGFNSDCKTCDNYYSIRFDDFTQSGIPFTNETDEGYKYNIREVRRPNSSRSNYTLQIDINSLINEGVTNGAQLSAAMVSITSQCFDMHYTQYAAEGSKFYIYDDREQNFGAPDATFDTVPLPLVNVDEFGFKLYTDDGREMELYYKYDFTDAADWINITMTKNSSGKYVYANGIDDTNGYREYDPAKDDPVNPGDPVPERFTLTETFKDPNGTPGSKPLNFLSDVVYAYADYAIDKMLKKSTVSLNALDYTYMNVSGEELPNVAVKSLFETSFTDGEKNGIHIQNSAAVDDSVVIPKFRMNTLVLNLHKARTRDYEESQATIAMADDAVRILSEKRSLYGAWQNRLEHIYANSCNMQENSQASESRIRDADMADEMVKYSKHNILEQAGQAILAKANQSANGVLNLLSEN